MVVVRSLYWINSSRASCRTMFIEMLCYMGFLMTVADTDVYFILESKPNVEEYYELLPVYMNDVLCCWNNPQLIMDTLYLAYGLRNGLVVPPTIYLGAEIKKCQVKSGKSHWSVPSTQYVNNAIKTLEVLFKYEDIHLRKVKADGNQTLLNRYRP